MLSEGPRGAACGNAEMTDQDKQENSLTALSAPGFDVPRMQGDAWNLLLSKVQVEQGYLLEGDDARRQDRPESVLAWVRDLIQELPTGADAGGLEILAMEYAYLAEPLSGDLIVIDQAHSKMWGTATHFKAVPFDQDTVTGLICDGHYPMLVPESQFHVQDGSTAGVQA